MITDNYFDLEFSVLLLLVTLGVSIYLLLAGLFGFSNYHVLNPSVWLYSDRVFLVVVPWDPGERRCPLYNFKTAQEMATKITQNNVLTMHFQHLGIT